MSKQRKPAPNLPKTPAASPKPSAKAATWSGNLYELPAFFQDTKRLGWLVFGFAILLYVNTLGHQWAQDDAIVITDNMFTQKGVSGIGDIFSKDTFFGFFKTEGKANLVSGGRYRPFTVALFAVIYQAVGKTPMAFHLLTLLLFAATCLLLFHTLLLLLKDYRDGGYANLAAFVTTLLFAAHPVHVEVVANIKGCDEIITLLGSLGTLYFIFKAFDTGNKLFSGLAAGAFFIALLSKENAATFLAVIPLALVCFRGASWGQAFGQMLWPFVAFAVFFGIRSAVLPTMFGEPPIELMNNPYVKWTGSEWVKFSGGEKFATIFYTLGKYLQLLFFPLTLTHDYYPRYIDIQSFAKPSVLLSLAAYGWLAWYSFGGILKGKRDLLRFGIAFYLLTLSIVSNLIFPVGTNMAERFMFMPSVGFCMAAAAMLLAILKKPLTTNFAQLPTIVLLVAVALFSLKTFSRNSAWYNDTKLFFTDVKTSVGSAKILNACGGESLTLGQKETNPARRDSLFQNSIRYLSDCVKIHPTYKDAYLNRGISYFQLKDFDRAIADFRFAAQVAPDDPKGNSNLAIALRDGGKFYGEQKHDLATAMKYLNESVKITPTDVETLRLLGVAYGVAGQTGEAIKWFGKVVEVDPKNANGWYDLSVAYGFAGDKVKAKELEAKALQMNPNLLNERSAANPTTVPK